MSHLSRVGLFLSAFILLAPAARATDQEAINRAIDRGVASLKNLQQGDGTWPHPQVGATALAGLTLLECDMPPADPAIRKAADAVRSASVHLTHTYSIALSLLFLDRLGEEADVAIIESLTVRLLAGQTAHGGWDYSCPDVPEAESRRLTSLLKQRNELTTRPKSAEPQRTADKTGEAKAAGQRELTKEIRQQIEVINRAAPQKPTGRDDNSNTQFAVLALWVARRHGLPVEGALDGVNIRFRNSQNGDGGWDYMSRALSPGGRGRGGKSTATMTCSGLLGLAVVHGVAEAVLRTEKPKEGQKPKDGDKAHKLPDATRDPVVRAGLTALGSSIGHPVGNKKGKHPPALTHGGRMYYFLWSLERVGVAYGLKTIGGKDWYGWGSEILVANQQNDGSWKGDFFAMGADTCFALLFLKRANLARDLTLALRGKVEDPGEVTLTAGGLGGEGIKQRLGLKPALEDDEMFGGTKSEGDAPRVVKPAAQDAGDDTTRLAQKLVKAAADKRDDLITEMRDAKGAAYTEALAVAIPQLDEDSRKQAREALAERLSRMTSATLGVRLEDDSREVRRAAALAVAMKEDKAHVGRLIELLDDKEPLVSRAAHAALKSLSNQDFGPAADASREERKQAVAAWRAWWKQNGKR
jgi:hypothetical protein